MHTIDTALTNVEREWQAYGVSSRDRAALAADLRGDLQSAADSGAGPEELIGADVRGFARRLADEAGVHRSQAEYGRVVATSLAGSVLGLAVHFTLMAVMVTIYMIVANRRPSLQAKPLQWGVIYGLITYVAMNLIVVPLRFGNLPSARGVATQLFCHIVLVGIPIAWIASRHFRSRSALAT